MSINYGAEYTHITGAGTTVVKAAVGILNRIVINTKGASANTLTVYDNTAGSGTVIAVIDTTSVVGDITYDLTFKTGLTVVSATGTGADITVVWS